MLGIPEAIASVAKLVDGIISRIWPDASEVEKAKATQLAAEIQNAYNIQLAQIKVNEAEAQSPSLFIGGWRPAVGWSCTGGFFYEFVLRPIVNGVLVGFGVAPIFPGIEIDALNTLLFGLLGLGAYRTVEKVQKVANP